MYKTMLVIVVGGGNTGSQLALFLLQEGYQVKIIDNRKAVLERLYQELPKEVILEGDGSSPSVLEKAGIKDANVLAAVTGEDDANLVISTLGRFEFNVPRIIARVNNPKNAWLFTPEMGVDVAMNQARLCHGRGRHGGDALLLRVQSLHHVRVPGRSRPQNCVRPGQAAGT
jgi:trk system potassium uptake protein TrkA